MLFLLLINAFYVRRKDLEKNGMSPDGMEAMCVGCPAGPSPVPSNPITFSRVGKERHSSKFVFQSGARPLSYFASTP